jgi:hypothetical protein
MNESKYSRLIVLQGNLRECDGRIEMLLDERSRKMTSPMGVPERYSFDMRSVNGEKEISAQYSYLTERGASSSRILKLLRNKFRKYFEESICKAMGKDESNEPNRPIYELELK